MSVFTKIWKGSPNTVRQPSNSGSSNINSALSKSSSASKIHKNDKNSKQFLWQTNLKTKSRNQKQENNSSYPEIFGDEQQNNPFSNLQLLTFHQDIVRHLILLPAHRCVSGGDDGNIVIWDMQTGERLHALNGHIRPLTCVYWSSDGESDNKDVLFTASSDKTICLWDIDRGENTGTWSNHNSTVKAMLEVTIRNQHLLVTAGEKLLLWDFTGTILVTAERPNQDDIQDVLSLPRDHLLACVDGCLEIYRIRAGEDEMIELSLHRRLKAHREAIGKVCTIGSDAFASGSLDGSIIIWDANDYTELRHLNALDEYEGDENLYPYSVQCLLCIEKRYLVCGLGSGFCIYDTNTGHILCEKMSAHYSKLLHCQFVYDGFLLATSSEDGSIRLWGSPSIFQLDALPDLKDVDNTSTLARFLGIKQELLSTIGPFDHSQRVQLLGECLGHAGGVQTCVDVPGTGFISCGADGLVIIWKDKVQQSLRENRILRNVLFC